MYALNGKLKEKLYISIGIILLYSIGAFQFLCLDRINTGRFQQFEGEVVTVNGYVDSEPDIKEAKVSYIIKVVDINTSDGVVKSAGKILLSTVKNDRFELYEYGSELKFTGQFNLPKGVRNPGGFDYRRYLAQKGVSGSIFALSDSIVKGSGRRRFFLIEAGSFLRMRIVGVIERSLPKQQAGLLNGILIGYRDGLSNEVKDAFSDAGLTHIMAVSGANVAFLVFPLLFIFKKLRIRPTVTNILVIAFLIIFVFITGFEPSVLRAVIMAIVILTGKILSKEADIYTSISFAAILLLIYSPYMLFNIGFQLSFAATLSLIMLYKNIKKLIKCRFIPDKAADVLAATLAAQIGVLPVMVYFFNKISIISVLTNILVVPLIEVITILGMLMAVLGQLSIIFSQLPGYINCILLSFVLYVSKISASLPFSTLRLITPSILAILAYYTAVWFLLLYMPGRIIVIKFRYIAAVFSVAVIIAAWAFLTPDKLEVIFLDVGEGDSTFIRTCTGKTILLDGGGSTNPDLQSTIGESVIIPFLLDRGITKLDLVIASHGHSDHIQGLIPVLSELKVSNLIIPSAADEKEFKVLLQTADRRGVKVDRCVKGDVIKVDDKTCFDVLNPLMDTGTNISSLNNTSLVLKLYYGEADVLFTGDVQKEVENLLLDSKTDLSADIVKIAHHGSVTSTSKAFIDVIKPKAAVISVGRNNFGHPSSKVVEMLEDCGIKLFRTDEDGAVILTSGGKNIKMIGTVKE